MGVGAVVRRRSGSAGMKKGRMERVAFGPVGITPRDAGVRERGGRARWGVGGELRPRSGWDSVGTRGASTSDISDARRCTHSFPAVGLVSGRYNQFADGSSYALRGSHGPIPRLFRKDDGERSFRNRIGRSDGASRPDEGHHGPSVRARDFNVVGNAMPGAPIRGIGTGFHRPDERSEDRDAAFLGRISILVFRRGERHAVGAEFPSAPFAARCVAGDLL